jgi:hypothetical protein
MTRTLPFLLGGALALCACGTEHLGPGVGTSYRAALRAQTEHKESDRPMGIDARDATAVLMAHFGRASLATGSWTVGAVAPSAAASTVGGEGSLGSNGPIRLEAH